MGLSEWFETFNNTLRMTKETTDSISYRYRRMTKQINKDFFESASETANSLYVGSYGRGTDIHVSDIDMLAILPYAKYKQYDEYSGNGQSALLQEVKKSIEKTYKSYMRADGQVIKIEFTDGIIFELVPCFLNNDGSYTYPDTNNGGSWKVTRPKQEIAEMTAKNNLWNKNLKRLCRMVRAWKEKWDVPMGGLLIDTLAYNFMKNWEYKDKSYYYYDYISRDFFEFLAGQKTDQQYWYAPGSNQSVYCKDAFEAKAKKAYNLAVEAIEHERADPKREWSAKQKWREIYGTKFPD